MRQRTCPSHVPHGSGIPLESNEWMQEWQSEMQEAMNSGDLRVLMELTSLLGNAAEKLAEFTGGMVP